MRRSNQHFPAGDEGKTTLILFPRGGMTQLGFVALAIGLFASPLAAAQTAETVSSTKKQMIQESIASYPGNCACPYQYASNGSICGRRSAYSKPGGYEPLCYETDITDEQAGAWLHNHHR
jgi:hypothetical protein